MQVLPITTATGTNNSAKQVSVDVWNAGHKIIAATDRTALAGVTGEARRVAYLGESGREGEFIFDSSDLSSKVSADTRQGVYVAPSSDTTGASGAWVRRFDGAYNVRWFGAAGDGTTDDYAAFDGAIALIAAENLSGGALYVPATSARYRLSQKLVFEQNIRLFGDGVTQNPGIVSGTSYAYPTYYKGSVLYFDAGVGGLDFIPFTDEEDMLTVLNDITANGTSSAYYEFQQSLFSSVENLFVLSASNGSGAFADDANGIQARSAIRIHNVWVRGFRGHGVRLEGTQDGAGGDGAMWGSVNLSTLINVHSENNVGSGFHIDGRDANVICLIGCDASFNDLWGFNDESLLGNCYVNCHCNNNNLLNNGVDAGTGGSFRCSGTSAACTYIGCYVEGTGINGYTSLEQASVVVGGQLSGNSGVFPTISGLILGGDGAVSGFGALNTMGDNDVKGGLGINPSGTAENIAMWWGAAAEGAGKDSWKLKYDATAKKWRWNFANGGSSSTPMEFPSSGSNWRTSTIYAPSFPQGIFLGVAAAGPRIYYGTAAPASGTWAKGDMVINSDPAVGEPPSWHCTVAGSPGTWAAAANLA